MEITENSFVLFDYTMKNSITGEVLSTSIGKEPCSYIHGVTSIVPGLVNIFEGKSKGDSFNCTLSPAQAFGNWLPRRIYHASKFDLIEKSDDVLEVGMKIPIISTNGLEIAKIISIEGDNNEKITLDANKPYAGLYLDYSIKILNVRESSPSERNVQEPGNSKYIQKMLKINEFIRELENEQKSQENPQTNEYENENQENYIIKNYDYFNLVYNYNVYNGEYTKTNSYNNMKQEELKDECIFNIAPDKNTKNDNFDL